MTHEPHSSPFPEFPYAVRVETYDHAMLTWVRNNQGEFTFTLFVNKDWHDGAWFYFAKKHDATEFALTWCGE